MTKYIIQSFTTLLNFIFGTAVVIVIIRLAILRSYSNFLVVSAVIIAISMLLNYLSIKKQRKDYGFSISGYAIFQATIPFACAFFIWISQCPYWA